MNENINGLQVFIPRNTGLNIDGRIEIRLDGGDNPVAILDHRSNCDKEWKNKYIPEIAFKMAAASELYDALEAILYGTAIDELNRDDDGLLGFGFDYGKKAFAKRIEAAKSALKKARGEA